jgi:dipeptide/tripeptide permease
MVAACFIGTGTAIFKPPAHGTIAKSTNEESSSLGWGIFYWTVNIGGALAPMGAAWLRVEIDWHRVFYAAAIVTACNFVPAFLLYREPEKDPEDIKKHEGKGIVATFSSSIATIFGDLRLVVFLGIFSCFWLMFMQLWDLLPNFIDEWVNTSEVVPIFGWFSSGWILDSGQVKPEMIININPISIIILVIPISWLIGKIHKVAAMVIGMTIALVGFVGAGYTSIGLFCCAMILVFSIGEMVCSPTFSAYVGLIAPKDKKALYMGYSNIPFAIGWAAGNGIGGVMYEHIASKFNLAREYMVNNLGMDASVVMDEAKLPKEQVMGTLAHVMESGDGAGVSQAIADWWAGTNTSALAPEELAATIDEGFREILGGLDPAEATRATEMLWNLHHPYMVWVYLGVMGLIGTVGMILFYAVMRKSLTAEAAQSGGQK